MIDGDVWPFSPLRPWQKLTARCPAAGATLLRASWSAGGPSSTLESKPMASISWLTLVTRSRSSAFIDAVSSPVTKAVRNCLILSFRLGSGVPRMAWSMWPRAVAESPNRL